MGQLPGAMKETSRLPQQTQQLGRDSSHLIVGRGPTIGMRLLTGARIEVLDRRVQVDLELVADRAEDPVVGVDRRWRRSGVALEELRS